MLSGLGQSRTAVQNKHQYKFLHRYFIVITQQTKLSENYLSQIDYNHHDYLCLVIIPYPIIGVIMIG